MPAKPLPRPMPWDREYWESAARGLLSIQRCASCGHLQHYPRPACTNCLGADFTWVPSSGRGVVHSFTRVLVPVHPAFGRDEARILVDVELEEGVRILSVLDVGQHAGDPALGDPVDVYFEETSDPDVYLPCFRLSDR